MRCKGCMFVIGMTKCAHAILLSRRRLPDFEAALRRLGSPAGRTLCRGKSEGSGEPGARVMLY